MFYDKEIVRNVVVHQQELRSNSCKATSVAFGKRLILLFVLEGGVDVKNYDKKQALTIILQSAKGYEIDSFSNEIKDLLDDKLIGCQ